LLDSGAALHKFLAICEAQGGFSEPTLAPQTRPVPAVVDGQLRDVDNRRLAKIAKLAGAPGSASAGIDCRLRIGDTVRAGEPLFHVHAHTPGELEYALDYATAHPDIFGIEGLHG
jgi:thymidine phosphorylase